jgi:hypothetical protein
MKREGKTRVHGWAARRLYLLYALMDGKIHWIGLGCVLKSKGGQVMDMLTRGIVAYFGRCICRHMRGWIVDLSTKDAAMVMLQRSYILRNYSAHSSLSSVDLINGSLISFTASSLHSTLLQTLALG